MNQKPELTADEMEAETAAALPDREAMSLLDITADLDLAARPRRAHRRRHRGQRQRGCARSTPPWPPTSASVGSEATAVADQDSVIIQDLDGTAIANANQDATVQQ